MKMVTNSLKFNSTSDLLIPVLLSPEVLRSELVFVYEKPTPAGDSRKRIFASENQFEKRKKIVFSLYIVILKGGS